MTTTSTIGAIDAEKPRLYERALLSRVVAVVTGKGGILKTATICGIAAAAARRGLKVLVVDMDKQGTASKREFGLKDDPGYDHGNSLARALKTVMMLGDAEPPAIVEGVRRYPQKPAKGGTARPDGQVDLIAGGNALGATVEAMTTLSHVQKDMTYGHCLAVLLCKVTAGYHLVLIDNDPGDRPVRLMVLEAAAASYAPIDFDPAAYEDGLDILISEIAEARDSNPEHVFFGGVGGRLPASTMSAWRAERTRRQDDPERISDGRGGKMAEIAGKVNPILDSAVFDYERSIVPGYPKLFEAMVRNAALDVSNAREAGVTLIDHLVAKCPPGASDEELFAAYPVLGDYDALTRELLAGVAAVQKARAA